MRTRSTIGTVIFDLGGVYFSDGTKRAINLLSSRFNLPKEEVAEHLNGQVGSAYRTGKLTLEQFWERFKRRWRLQVSSEELTRIWFEGYELNRATEHLVIMLRSARYSVLYLSDNVPERVAYLEQRYHFLQYFVGGVFSYEIGVRKPHVGMYESILAKIAVPPNTCVYIDDVAGFLEPAAALGMTTVHFISAKQLTKELHDLGLSF